MTLDDPGETIGVNRRLVHHDAVELGQFGGRAHEGADRLGEPVAIRGRRGAERVVLLHDPVEAAEEMVDRRPPQLLLRLEVVVDLGLVRPGTRGDGARGRTVEPVGRELVQRRVEQCLAGDGGALLTAPGGGRCAGCHGLTFFIT